MVRKETLFSFYQFLIKVEILIKLFFRISLIRMKHILIELVVINDLVKSLMAFSFMVPQDSCFDMRPRHNNSNQLSTAPYQIIPTKLNYLPLESIKGFII